MMINEKIYLNPGDLVRVRHSKLENLPIMYVVEKVSRTIKTPESIESAFIGIKCRWFDKDQKLNEAVFSTKDLEKIN